VTAGACVEPGARRIDSQMRLRLRNRDTRQGARGYEEPAARWSRGGRGSRSSATDQTHHTTLLLQAITDQRSLTPSRSRSRSSRSLARIESRCGETERDRYDRPHGPVTKEQGRTEPTTPDTQRALIALEVRAHPERRNPFGVS
jgi:hypothetical protein